MRSTAAVLDDATRDWRGERASDLWEESRRRGGSQWHDTRARSLARGWAPRVDRCGQPAETPEGFPVIVHCGACGAVHPAQDRCEQRHQCKACARRYWGPTCERLKEALRPLAEELRRRGRSVHPVKCGDAECGCASIPNWVSTELRMWTLTIPHSGDLSADLDLLAEGWARMRGWLHHHGLTRLHEDRRGQRFTRVAEVTPSDGGHVHYHVLIESPPICFEAMRQQWRLSIRRPNAIGIDVQRPRTMSADVAASYLATYATKGADLPVDVLADWIPAAYGRRIISSSRGLLGPKPRARCPEDGCGEQGTLQRGVDFRDADPARGPPRPLGVARTDWAALGVLDGARGAVRS